MGKRSAGASLPPAWLAALLCTLALAGCDDYEGDAGTSTDAPAAEIPTSDGSDGSDGVGGGAGDIGAPAGPEREARAAELFAPRETLALTGTRWQVEALVLPDVGKLPLLSGLVHTIEFGEGGERARGDDGCGTYRRDYARDGDALRLGPPKPSVASVADSDDCALTELGAVERSIVTDLLGATEAFEIRGDRLILEGADDAALVLRGDPLSEIPAGVGPGIDPEFAAGEPVPFAVLERSDGANLGERQVSVPERFVTAHDADAFASLWRNAHSFDPDSPAPEVAFDVGGVVAVFSPLRATLGHGIRIDAIVAGAGGPRDGPRVLVTTTLPGPGCAVGEVATVPYEIVAVPTLMPSPRFEETVVEDTPCG